MRGFGVFVFALWAAFASAFAQSLPQLYDVTGVAADDVLNIRAAPSAGSAIIGALAPNARGVEVVATNDAGTWGQVNAGEGAGWVSLRFMAAQGVAIDDSNLPIGLACFGTEPFWSLSHDDGALRFTTTESAPRDLPLWIAQDSGVPGDLTRMLRFAGPDGPAVAHIFPSACTDGMSDRAFGLSAALMLGLDGALLRGCCSLTR